MAVRYRHHGLAIVRTTTDPGELKVPGEIDLADPAVIGGEGQEWLAKTWARAEVREAIKLASPDLAARISQLLAAPGGGCAKDFRRAITSLASYLLRWQRRVTPFGLFAGILPATVGPVGGVIGTAHRAFARPSSEWTAAVARELSRNAALRSGLTVVADSTAIVRDGRLILERRTVSGAQLPAAGNEKSVRWTRPVQVVLELALAPVRFSDLIDGLCERFPRSPAESLQALADELTDQGFLITSLYPPMTVTDPLGHLCAALHAAGAGQIPEVAAQWRELEGIRSLVAAHDNCADPAEAEALRAAASARMTALVPSVGPALSLDLRVDGHVDVPAAVMEEAAAAAAVLLRLTTRPFGSMAWVEYQARFKERYGPGALVPVRDLIADSGLGYPAGYLGAPAARPVWRTLTDRDAVLLDLIQQAGLSGCHEVRLSPDDIKALTIGDPAAIVPPHRAEITVAVHASSADAITTGNFELQVTGVARFPGSMAGRFAHLLTDAERGQLAETFATGDNPGQAMAVQVSFPPRVTRNEHMTRSAPLTGTVLHLGEHPDHGETDTVSLGDLAVTADAAEMYLVHAPSGRRVVPHIAHSLEMTAHTPALARFIAEIAGARHAELRPLDHGAARVLPYVPRIRYRKTILSPARWLLKSTAITAGPRASRDQRLADWRQAWRVPTRVVLCHGEERLPLDLSQPLDCQLLYAHLDREPRAELREDRSAGADGWLGRPAELLIPLTLIEPRPRPLPTTVKPGAVHQAGSGEVMCVRITGNPARFDTIIARRLPPLADQLGAAITRWWVSRYRDMIQPESSQHIAVYLRLTGRDSFGAVAAELSEFAASLERDGLPGTLALASYYEHPGRYGHGDALGAAEAVWAADTAAAVAQLAMAAHGTVPAQALAAASMTTIASAFAVNPASGCQALTACLEQGSGPVSRPLRDLACALADPSSEFAALRALPGGHAIAETWEQRDIALAAYHEQLSAQRRPVTVLRTLLHDHHVRAIGIDPAFEKQTGRLARAAALRRLALASQS